MRIKRLPIPALVLLLAACTADTLPPVRQTLEAGPQAQDTVPTRLVHYRATVSDADGDGHTRATLNTDGKYVYSAGDMLFVRGTGADKDRVYGALLLNGQDAGKSSGVTFEGSLHLVGYEEGQEPPADMPLEAVLVGPHAQLYDFNDLCDQITGSAWPQDGALTTTLAKAVERYSTLTAQSTYGQQAFQLSQGSCFVEFSVTLDDGTEAEEEIGAYVWTDAEPTDSRSGTVTTFDDGEGHIKANFVAAFPGGDTVLDGAVVGLGGRSPISFGGSGTTLLANRIYHVNRTFTRQPATISFNMTSLVKSHPDARFPITVNNSGTGAVTYESSNPAVATVAYDDIWEQWMVTITGVGEADLTATVQDCADYVYSEHTASYHLTVYDPVPLATATAAHVGWVIGPDGNVYATVSGVYAATEDNAVAMIGYVGDPGSADASSTTYRGLAVALNEAATTVAWTNSANRVCTDNACDQDNFPAIVASMAGISNTDYLADHLCRSGSSDTHTHEAATAARDYLVPGFMPGSIGCSNWFLPTTGQWFKVLGACGVATGQWTTLGNCPGVAADNYTAIQRLMTAAGGTLGEYYWTSTERTENRFAYHVSFGSSFGVSMMIHSKTAFCNVRPFIAF